MPASVQQWRCPWVRVDTQGKGYPGLDMVNVFSLTLLFIGMLTLLSGHYQARLKAMEMNPVVRTRIMPRTMYDDVMGVDWVSRA